MSKEYNLGDRMPVLEMPDGSIYRIMRMVLHMKGEDPTIELSLIGWSTEANFDIGEGDPIHRMEINLDVSVPQLRGLEEVVLAAVKAQLRYFETATPRQKLFTKKCGVCGLAIESKDERMHHIAHICSECGENWDEPHHGHHGVPLPDTNYVLYDKPLPNPEGGGLQVPA